MFKVTKKPLTPNTVWDAENNRPLCRFTNGVLETNDKDLAEALQAMGHTVSGEADAPVGDAEGAADPEGTPEGDPDGGAVNTPDADATATVSGEADAAPKTNRRNRSK